MKIKIKRENTIDDKHARFSRSCISNLRAHNQGIEQKNEERIQYAPVDKEKKKKVNQARIVNHVKWFRYHPSFVAYNRKKSNKTR